MQKTTTLQDAFREPINRESALELIKSEPEAYQNFLSFPLEHQANILEFIQGNRGLPILYDPFFKKIFNPSDTPERLERFLSCLMQQSIRIVEIIPREGTQLVEKGSFVIMDILVQAEDGSYINVEMQKHGYKFTGERSTCYMSDLVMRQYTKVKSEKKENFTFKDMKPVYLIVLMENSSANFKKVAPEYVHRTHYVCDTGAEITFLANYTYISLDTFRSVRQNITSYLDAWFTFLSSDDPNDIINLISEYPEFKEYYHDIANFRKTPKELMTMYSEVLAQIDKNTERYMIEEMQKELEDLRIEKESVIAEINNVLAEKNNALAEKDNALAEKDNALAEKDAYIKQLESQLGIKHK